MQEEKLKKLLDIGRQLAETRELDLLLASAMDMALEFAAAEFGYLVLLDGDQLVFRVGRDRQGNHLPAAQERISHTIFDEVIRTRKPKITEDALTDIPASSVFELRLRSVMCAPLIARERVLGAVYIENRTLSHLFKKDDLELLAYFAAQAAVAIENAMLNEELEARVQRRTAELAQANERLRELAITDALTGVYNRRHFFELAAAEKARASREGGMLSVIMLDLDHFKRVNDLYGHLAGDRVLQAAVRIMGEEVRVSDVLGRYGGEEFSILLPGTDAAGARQIAERLCRAIASKPVEAAGEVIQVTASLGVASLAGAEETSVEALLDRADEALYAAKQAGRNRVMAWEDGAGLHA